MKVIGIVLLVIFGIACVMPILLAIWTLLGTIVDALKDTAIKSRQKKQRQYVINESNLLRQLTILNSKYTFKDIQPIYLYTRKCKSKNEYNRTNPYDFFCIVANENKKQLSTIKEMYIYNRNSWVKYYAEYERLVGLIDSKGLGTNYKKTELEELEKAKLTPCINPIIKIEITYQSPQGRKWARSVKEYSFDDFDKALSVQAEQSKTRREHKAMIEYERALMTEKMRYAVLSRDKFKCVICGATAAEDGVKLHVDHIKPVSKGGKTELSNLQTLCSRCNLGKSDS